ncbi:MAG: hypothetical protein ACLTZT_00215 [Butyricimonas faecalis]
MKKGDSVTLIPLYDSRNFVGKRNAMKLLDRALNKIGYTRSVNVEQKVRQKRRRLPRSLPCG